jgi:hypothetical protein
MTLAIKLDDPVEGRIAGKGDEFTGNFGSRVCQVVEAHATKPTPKELSGEICQQVVISGMTNEGLDEYLERDKQRSVTSVALTPTSERRGHSCGARVFSNML